LQFIILNSQFIILLDFCHQKGRWLNSINIFAVSTEVTPVCAKGCDLCSEYNGCLKCSPKLFILLERNDIRQIGICLPSCPMGYFGVRNPEMNKCIKCKIENCEACFSRNFCTKCKEGLYLHKGRCYSSCPEGFAAANGTMECSSPAQCEMSEWSPWGPCMKRKKLCGFKKGTEERTRTVLQAPSGDPSTCPPTTESRRCTVQKKLCSGGKWLFFVYIKKKKKARTGFVHIRKRKKAAKSVSVRTHRAKT
uniref:R-spondin 1 n=1 Tax=Latimeria chalumnae TaxID=7897 RepID=H3BBH9_LATCH